MSPSVPRMVTSCFTRCRGRNGAFRTDREPSVGRLTTACASASSSPMPPYPRATVLIGGLVRALLETPEAVHVEHDRVQHRRTEAVLRHEERAEPEGTAHVHHAVDVVLQVLRAGDLPVLGHVADQDDDDAVRLGLLVEVVEARYFFVAAAATPCPCTESSTTTFVPWNS